MFSSKPNYLKLRTNLRLCINRLKLLEKKKTELALKSRREIADYITAGKDDRARIRVEHIVREDYLVEAMEIVEMLCDLLLARIGLIEKMTELDPGIEETVATLIWVAPRLSTDIQELREVAHQLMLKYGKEFSEMCRRNGFGNVNEKVIHKMSLAAPPKLLVEHYMIEIARTYKVPFEPDPLIMAGQPDVSNLIDLGVDALAPTAGASAGPISPQQKPADSRHILRDGVGGAGGQSEPSSFAPGSTPGLPGASCGFAGGYPIYSNIGMPGDRDFPSANNNASVGFNGNPTHPSSGSSNVIGPGWGAAGQHGFSDGGFDMKASQGFGFTSNKVGANETDFSSALIGGVPVLPSEGSFPPPVPPGYLPPSGILPSPSNPYDPAPATGSAGGQAGVPPAAGARAPLNPQMSWINDDYLPSLPSYDQVVNPYDQDRSPRTADGSNALGPDAMDCGSGTTLPDIPKLPDVPGLPSVPSNSVGGGSAGGDDVDFDDLTRRFEELKNRK